MDQPTRWRTYDGDMEALRQFIRTKDQRALDVLTLCAVGFLGVPGDAWAFELKRAIAEMPEEIAQWWLDEPCDLPGCGPEGHTVRGSTDVTPHSWDGTHWTCLACGHVSADPCDCDCGAAGCAGRNSRNRR